MTLSKPMDIVSILCAPFAVGNVTTPSEPIVKIKVEPTSPTGTTAQKEERSIKIEPKSPPKVPQVKKSSQVDQKSPEQMVQVSTEKEEDVIKLVDFGSSIGEKINDVIKPTPTKAVLKPDIEDSFKGPNSPEIEKRNGTQPTKEEEKSKEEEKTKEEEKYTPSRPTSSTESNASESVKSLVAYTASSSETESEAGHIKIQEAPKSPSPFGFAPGEPGITSTPSDESLAIRAYLGDGGDLVDPSQTFSALMQSQDAE